ncbi:sushi domain-containing protein 1 [Chanos chanos]|uniref:Sushi domain-containing protein 1 n=1 Tax=Chanos chanos TaxID=29144 RepID=A0A6J2WTM4_CHACN|nr:sushi domain-containing protein 1-like [Chanos chanos]
MSRADMSLRTAVVSTVLCFLSLQSILKGVEVGADPVDVCSLCHPNATCEDKADGSPGKVCNCMYGFVGNGLTHCQDKDECQMSGNRICGNHTTCHNTYGSFYCTCLRGYTPSNSMPIFIPNDGTYCHDIDECRIPGICGEGGHCKNTPGDFTCSCQTGYRVQNGSEPFNSKRDKAFCRAIDCGQPPSVTHAIQLLPIQTKYGSVVKYHCMTGFLWKSGKNSSTCGHEGIWTVPNLVCEEVDCGSPPSFPHSEMIWNKNGKMGSVAFYLCDVGFRNTGHENVSVCTAKGTWSQPSFLCEEIVCGDPPVLPHSVMTWNRDIKMGSEVVYECAVGYQSLGGENVSVCMKDGQWSKPSMTCEEISCGDPPVLPYTGREWNGSSKFGSVVVYFCHAGYYHEQGDNKSFCADNGFWTTSTIVCKVIDCGDPPALPNSVMLWNRDTKLGSEVLYECKPGFNNTRSENVSVCTPDSYWSRPDFWCQASFLPLSEIVCGAPPTLPNSVMQWDRDTKVNSEVFYKCDVGYHSVGSGNVSICTTIGQWSDPSMTCEETSCGPPPVLPNTVLNWDQTSRLGSTVQYACKYGFYQESGENLSTCTSAGRWEKVSISCRALCGPAPFLAHAELAWENTTTIRYRCQTGYYRHAGSDTSVCDVRGQWQAATLQCKVIKYGVRELVVFNERCLRWRADEDGEKEHYRVEFVGLRDYDKSFRDWRKKEFSSAADRPVLCLHLLPATNYTINITALLAQTSTTTITNTSIHIPPVPAVTYSEVEVPLPTLRLHRSPHSLDQICVYQVFVLPIEETLVFDCRLSDRPHLPRQTQGSRAYVAAQIQLRDLGRELHFTVGDEQAYGGYYNAPLENGRDYYIILRTVCQWGKSREQSCVIWAKATGTPRATRLSALITAGSIGITGVAVFIGYCCKWLLKRT